jgi:hypothetical protein
MNERTNKKSEDWRGKSKRQSEVKLKVFSGTDWACALSSTFISTKDRHVKIYNDKKGKAKSNWRNTIWIHLDTNTDVNLCIDHLSRPRETVGKIILVPTWQRTGRRPKAETTMILVMNHIRSARGLVSAIPYPPSDVHRLPTANGVGQRT